MDSMCTSTDSSKSELSTYSAVISTHFRFSVFYQVGIASFVPRSCFERILSRVNGGGGEVVVCLR